jgi:phosphatidylethanolamine-binding protein (PEBP) family uncharacterized protein
MTATDATGVGMHVRRWARRPLSLGVALATTLVIGGCGSSSPHPQTATSTSAAVTTSTSESVSANVPTVPEHKRPTASEPDYASLDVISPARLPDEEFDRRYSCTGSDESPPVAWGPVPAGTKEIMVIERSLLLGRLETDWMIAGILPPRDHIAAGSVPAGAVVGRDSAGKIGYDLCPKNSSAATTVVLAVFALPVKLSLKPGFSPQVLRTITGNPEVPWGSIVAYVQ